MEERRVLDCKCLSMFILDSDTSQCVLLKVCLQDITEKLLELLYFLPRTF